MRLVYCEMLGHDGSWGYIHAVKLTQSLNISEKRIGKAHHRYGILGLPLLWWPGYLFSNVNTYTHTTHTTPHTHTTHLSHTTPHTPHTHHTTHTPHHTTHTPHTTPHTHTTHHTPTQAILPPLCYFMRSMSSTCFLSTPFRRLDCYHKVRGGGVTVTIRLGGVLLLP